MAESCSLGATRGSTVLGQLGLASFGELAAHSWLPATRLLHCRHLASLRRRPAMISGANRGPKDITREVAFIGSADYTALLFLFADVLATAETSQSELGKRFLCSGLEEKGHGTLKPDFGEAWCQGL